DATREGTPHCVVALARTATGLPSASILPCAVCTLGFAASIKHLRISSPVAGNRSSLAAAVETQLSACFTAVHTHSACISGGSPTALLATTFSTLSSLGNNSQLKIGGTSVIAGILYVVGECDRSSPRSL